MAERRPLDADSLLLGATALCCTIWIWVVTYLHQYTFADDAFIFFRYAANIAAGDGPVFNPGEFVEGFTSPLWLGILSLFTLCNMDILHAATLLGMLLAVGTVLLVLYFPSLQTPTLFRILAAVLLSIHPWFLFWITSGMETFLFTFMLLGSATIFLRERHQNTHHIGSGICASLTLLSRPEGLLLFPLLLLGCNSTKKKVTFLLGWLPLSLGYQLFRIIYYDALLPNTAAVKASFTTVHLEFGTAYVLHFFSQTPSSFLALLPIGLVVFAKDKIASSDMLTLRSIYLFLIVMIAYFIGVGGDFFEHHRFFVPLYPWFTLLIAFGVYRVFLLFVPIRRSLAIAVVAVITFGSVWIGVNKSLLEKQHGVNWIIASGKLGVTLATDFPRDTYIAAPHIGALGYYSRLRLLDMLGLTNKHIAHAPTNENVYATYIKREVGHEKFDIPYALREGPDFFIPMHGFSSVPATHVSEIPARFAMEHALIEKVKNDQRYNVSNIPFQHNAVWIVLAKKPMKTDNHE